MVSSVTLQRVAGADFNCSICLGSNSTRFFAHVINSKGEMGHHVMRNASKPSQYKKFFKCLICQLNFDDRSVLPLQRPRPRVVYVPLTPLAEDTWDSLNMGAAAAVLPTASCIAAALVLGLSPSSHSLKDRATILADESLMWTIAQNALAVASLLFLSVSSISFAYLRHRRT